MALTLKITSYQSQVLGADGLKVFDSSGGSVGRAQGNDWVLPDPERYISGKHFTVSCQGGTYYLTDTSTNGVFVNQSTSPVGKGNTVALNDGDQLRFGDYEIAVSMEAATAEEGPFDQWPAAPVAEPAADQPLPGVIPESYDPFDSLEPSEPTGPGFSFETGQSASGSSPFGAAGAEPDHVSALEQSFQPPGVQVEQLPDDWDMTDFSGHSGQSPFSPVAAPAPPAGLPEAAKEFPGGAGTPAAAPVPRPLPAAAPPPSPAPAVQPQPAIPRQPAPAASAAGGGGADLFAAFLEGAGLDPQRVRQPDMTAAMRDYGMLFRVVVQGMMEVLMARASLKSELRMPLTTIRPVENNPLKFSPGVDEALYNLFVSEGRGYLGPVEAIQEGFADIKNHQMAMMAGMQAAFRELLEIFNPDKFDKDAASGMLALSINRKSRAWEAFCEFYERAARDPDTSFQNLFGENFALAYEDQIRRLSMLK